MENIVFNELLVRVTMWMLVCGCICKEYEGKIVHKQLEVDL